MSSVTTEELRSFHKIDRDLYFRLVVSLRRDAIQSMQVMALWLWLELVGYPNIVYFMLPVSDAVVNAVTEEAISCLTCLESDSPPPSTNNDDLPMTSTLMNIEISLQFFYRNRFHVIDGITKTVSDVCFRAFEDIAKQVIAEAVAEQNVVSQGNQQENVVGGIMPQLGPRLMFPLSLFHSGVVPPQFPSPPLFGVPQPSLLGTPSLSKVFSLGQLSMEESSDQQPGASFLNPKAMPWGPSEEVHEVERIEQGTPQDRRTMFVTFSRGYPMTEIEVHDFFTRKYGDCIETIIMQEVPADTQSLYARLVFYSVSQILDILDGREKVKFIINGKHVWARLYIPKQGSRVPPPPPPPAPPLPSTA